jgi:hypothetical protein
MAPAAALLVVRESSRDAGVTAIGVIQAPERAAADDCLARPTVATLTSANGDNILGTIQRCRIRPHDRLRPDDRRGFARPHPRQMPR